MPINPNHTSFFPITPTDKQVFVDSDFVQWVYDAKSNSWQQRGTVPASTLADSNSVGLMSHADKALLDRTPTHPGGFGLITNPRLTLRSPENPDGVITGDIKLLSDSLDITCVDSNGQRLSAAPTQLVPDIPSGEPSSPGVTGLQFKLKQEFIQNLYVDICGVKGLRGHTGLTGEQGPHGFSGGPRGDVGRDGLDIDQLCEFVGIKYRDVSELTDSPIVDMRLVDDDGKGCKLIVTKAKLNVGGDRPADKIAATGLSRSVQFPDAEPSSCNVSRLDNWSLIQPQGDETPANLQLLRIPKKSNDVIDEPVDLNATMSLEDFISDVVAIYKQRLTELDQQWGKQAKEHIEQIDDKARNILSSLADQLSMCEFNLPTTEQCVTFVHCDAP